jgi:hypothetical protein
MNKISISKPGYGVGTVTDPNELIFSSDYNTLKYSISGTTAYTIGSGSTSGETVLVTHSLGYIPLFRVYANDSPSYPTRYYSLPFSFADAFATDHRFVYANGSQIIFRYENSGFGIDIPINFAYKVFKNNLGL